MTDRAVSTASRAPDQDFLVRRSESVGGGETNAEEGEGAVGSLVTDQSAVGQDNFGHARRVIGQKLPDPGRRRLVNDMDHSLHPPPVNEGSTPRQAEPEPNLDGTLSKWFRRFATLRNRPGGMTNVTQTRKRGTMRRLSAIFLAAAVVLTAACSGGDKNSSDSSDGGSRTLFQPAGVVGPDSFAPTFAVASYDVDASSLTSGTVSGSAPGLYAGRTYGGSGQNICDVEAMIKFLQRTTRIAVAPGPTSRASSSRISRRTSAASHRSSRCRT